MAKKFSNKNELQNQLLAIYNNFKNGLISNRQAKKANNIIKILKSIDNLEIDKELEQYIYNNRLKSKIFVKACKPSLKCHLKYCFNFPENYKARTKKANEIIEDLDVILVDDFNQEVKSDTEKSKLKNLPNVMVKNETFAKLKKLY